MLRETIVATIDDYLTASGMSASGFGLAVVHDGKFLRNLRDGRVTFRNVEKALAFMSDNPPRRAQAAAMRGPKRAFARPDPSLPRSGAGSVPSAACGAVVASGHPLVRAAIVLGGRLAGVAGIYRLDGRHAAAADVVRAANEQLQAAGQPLIAYPGIALPEQVRR